MSKPKYYKYQGESRTLTEWAELYKMSRGCLERRVNVKQLSLADALKMPVNGAPAERTPEKDYHNRRARGICVDCGKKKKTLGHIRCLECQERKEESHKAARLEEVRSPRKTKNGEGAQTRKCLLCEQEFLSAWAGNRRCPRCNSLIEKHQEAMV